MSETPAAETTDKSGGFHLPVLPDGWKYGIHATGPDGQSVSIGYPEYGGGPCVNVSTGHEGDRKSFEVDSLAEGVKQGVKIMRTLRDLAEHEKRSATAREALLSQIGRPSPQREDGTLDTPDSLDAEPTDA